MNIIVGYYLTSLAQVNRKWTLVDIRVCASTGSDRENDEQKLSLSMAVML